MQAQRRWFLISGLGGAAALSAGCMTKPLRPPNADGTYCHRSGKSYRPTRTCTPTVIPALAVENEAKRFAPDPGAFTIYLVRKRWADGLFVVRVVSGSDAVNLVPETFARWRLRPGTHRLTASWSDGNSDLEISGSAGELLFVEVIGSAWVFGSSVRLAIGDPTASKDRAANLRLVADVG